MGLIAVYILAATIIASMALIDLYHPVLSEREMPLDIRVLYYITFFILAILAAPLLLLPCLSKTRGLEFREVIEKSLFEVK